LQEDQQRLAQANRVGIASGYMTVAEARERTGLEVREEDNVYIRQLSTIEVPVGVIRTLPEDIDIGASGPSGGGIGSSGANSTVIRDTALSVASPRFQSEAELKQYASDAYPHLGLYSATYRAMDDKGLLNKHS